MESVLNPILKDKWMFMGCRGISSHPVPACLGLLPSSLSGFFRACCSDKTRVPLFRNHHFGLEMDGLVCFVLFFASVSRMPNSTALGALDTLASTGMGSLFSA